MLKRLLILLCFIAAGFAQDPVTPLPGTARHIRWGASLPATCNVSSGDVFFMTTAGATFGPNFCSATNTWTVMGTTILPNNTIDIRSRAVACDGVIDLTAAINTVHATLVTMGGGVIQFPMGTCLISGHVVLPNNATGVTGPNPYSRQVGIRWQGSGPDIRNGEGQLPGIAGGTTFGGTLLKMTYEGNGATGPITTSVLDAFGSGYVVNDTGTVGGTCSGATYQVLAVNSTGGITNYSITAAGTACTVSDNVATATGGAQAGVGTGFTLEIRAVVGSDYGKIETYGLGHFEADHITFYDPVTSGFQLPFLYSTGTTVKIHDVSFISNSSGGTEGRLDDIVLGGPLATFSTVNDPLAAFQGYDSEISYCYTNRTRRLVLMQTYISATYIHGNFIGPQSGSNLSNGAAIEVYTPGGALGGVNMIVHNRIEGTYYTYPIKVIGSLGNYIAGNDIEDVTTAVATVGLFGNAQLNTAIVADAIGLLPFFEDSTSSGKNTVIDASSSGLTQFPYKIASGYVSGRVMVGQDGRVSSENTTPATSGANFGGTGGFHNSGMFWNGSASAVDEWKIVHALGAGANPVSNWTLSHTGSSGTSTFHVGNVVFTIGPNNDGWSPTGDFNGSGNFSLAGILRINNVDQYIQTTTAATSGANRTGRTFHLNGQYWNGSVTTLDTWDIQGPVFGSGTNPVSKLKITHTGSSGVTAISLQLATVSVFANNAAAITGGLAAGDLYRSGADPDVVSIVH